MFSIDKNEYVLENVAKAIKYECYRRGFDYKEDEIKYLALQEIVNPLGGFTGAHSSLEREVNSLMDLCINFLCDNENNFSIKTIITQSYYLQWYRSKESVAENYRKLIRDHTDPLVVDICRCDPRDDQAYHNLYRKIVLAMLLLSGIGDATKKDYIVAAEAALKSIFPPKNLEGFIHLSYHNKVKELDDLKKTVTGIILYNEYKINQSMTSNQQSLLLEEGSKVVLDKLSLLASCLDSLAATITLTVQDIVHFDTADPTLLVVDSSPFTDSNGIFATKTYLLLLQQSRRFIRTLLKDARDCQQDFYRQEDDYQFYLRSLLNELRGKVAISMNKVYSKFQEIGDIWMRQQELCVIFNSIHDTLSAVMALSEAHRMPDCLKKMTGCKGLDPVDVEELVSQVVLRTDSTYFYGSIDPLMIQGAEVVHLTDESSNKLEYNGFCPVYCVESCGFLVDARKEIGVVLFEEKYYGFRDVQAAYVFGKDPRRYTEKVIEFVRSNVDYLEVLGLSQDVIQYRGVYICSEGKTVKTRKPVREKEVQTDVHPIESFIDKDYTWNLWDHKKRAVKLADIVKCATSSSQSYSSHFRESATTQTYSPRENPSQTLRESNINTDNIPAETWCLRGSEPHVRLIDGDCLPTTNRKGKKPCTE